MESRKMQLVAGGLVLFLSGTMLGGYVVWSQQKPNSALNRARSIRNATVSGTKSKQMFVLPDARAAEIPVGVESANPPWTVQPPVSMPIGTKSAPVFMPEDVGAVQVDSSGNVIHRKGGK